jgi:hypothetical protein
VTAAVAIGIILAALGLFALVRLRRVPVERHVLPFWWRKPVLGPGLLGALPCPDCPGSVGRHNTWCVAIGGPGLALPAERDVRQVRERRRARRALRKAIEQSSDDRECASVSYGPGARV